ncbi:MAG TPA: hypothetical protein VFV34_00895 [Blastocatellia bacterium]|nr:hypothetical protein [Blastocatellia bacterium]
MVSFESIPTAAIHTVRLDICLKCAFDFFAKQLKLSPRTAFSELKKHTPETADLSGAATSRPHFFNPGDVTHCPYCNAPKRWFGQFIQTRIYGHPDFEKSRKKLWSEFKKKPDRFVLSTPKQTQFELFSEWLERMQRGLDLEASDWLLEVAVEQIKRAHLSVDWDEVLKGGVRRVQLSRETSGPWHYDKGWLYVSPLVYGDVLLIQHLLSRSHLHGGRTFEGRLTLQELVRRLRRIGYFDAREIDTPDPSEAFEQAIVALVASGPSAVYYAVDRGPYLEKLKSIYEKKRDKS